MYAEKMSGGKWKPYPYLKLIADTIQEAIRQGNGRIIINAPPRHGKTQLASVWLPIWFFDWFPEFKAILASYQHGIAADWGRRVRDELMQNPLVWTDVAKNTWAADNWQTIAGGGMRTAGAGGPLTGAGGQLLIVDDIHKNWEEAKSPTYRKRIIDWFGSTFYTRAEPGATVVVIQTRWHEGDLTGFLLDRHEDDWQLIKIPAIAEADDPVGRAEGEALCPERYDKDDLERIRKAIGAEAFTGLYQQRPSPPEGGMVKRTWFGYWDEPPDKQAELVQSWDMTFKEAGTSYVVGQVWARDRANCYLMDQWRDKVDFTGTVRAVRNMSQRWPKARTKLIEEAANGPAVISALKGKLQGVIAVKPKGSKASRLAAISPAIEGGNVLLPRKAPWVEDFVEEVVTFPNAANDDQVDAMTMALDRLMTRQPLSGIVLKSDALDRPSQWKI
jgi:predicted phage terminase large subunit-like protein